MQHTPDILTGGEVYRCVAIPHAQRCRSQLRVGGEGLQSCNASVSPAVHLCWRSDLPATGLPRASLPRCACCLQSVAITGRAATDAFDMVHAAACALRRASFLRTSWRQCAVSLWLQPEAEIPSTRGCVSRCFAETPHGSTAQLLVSWIAVCAYGAHVMPTAGMAEVQTPIQR